MTEVNYEPHFDVEFEASTHQRYITDLGRRAAQGEFSRRIMNQIEASPNAHAQAIADEVVRVVALRVWEMAYAVGIEDQAKADAEFDPNYPWADRQNPFEDALWIKSLNRSEQTHHNEAQQIVQDALRRANERSNQDQ